GDRKKERERGRKQKDVYSYLNSTLTTSEVGVWVEPVCLWPGRFWTQTHYTEQMTTHTHTHTHTKTTKNTHNNKKHTHTTRHITQHRRTHTTNHTHTQTHTHTHTHTYIQTHAAAFIPCAQRLLSHTQ